MAFASTTEWEVRTTGSDANGGGFNTASSGTDYSQQDAAQVAFTDLVIDIATNTKCTSVLNPFTAASVGNIINITGGTGFTVQRVQIVSVAANVATCDKSLGTLASVGGTGNLGGGLLTIGTAAGLMISLNTMHIKAGTYTITTVINTFPTSGAVLLMVGYQTTHNDWGTRPLLTTATNSTVLVTLANNNQQWRNIDFSNTAGTRAAGFSTTTANANEFNSCIFDGFTNSLANAINGGNFSFFNCEVKNCTDSGVNSQGSNYFFGCYVHNNSVHGLYTSNNAPMFVSYCIVVNNTTDGIKTSGGAGSFVGNTVAGNGGNGITFSAAGLILSLNILYGNSGFGFAGGSSGVPFRATNNANAFGANSSGPTSNLVAGPNSVTLTADPFTNSAGGDYSLNKTAGGGAACRSAGIPGLFPGGLTRGYPDIGAVQSQITTAVFVGRGVVGGMRG